LGIVGALVATYLGQAIGWYQAGEGAGLIGAIVGAVIVLVVWGLLAGRQRAPANHVATFRASNWLSPPWTIWWVKRRRNQQADRQQHQQLRAGPPA
jgi:Transglycosylase associated protein